MLESEAMAILVGAGVSYGRREAALRAAGSALAILAEPGLYAAQLQERGWRCSGTRLRMKRACLEAWRKRRWRSSCARTRSIRRCFGRSPTRRTCSMSTAQTDLTDRFPVAVVGTRRASAYGLNAHAANRRRAGANRRLRRLRFGAGHRCGGAHGRAGWRRANRRRAGQCAG
ncbi:MAG: hypothetical protein ACLUHE_03900 [Christensenellales bacterium]